MVLERSAIASSLQDKKTVVRKFDTMLKVFFGVLGAILCQLCVLGVTNHHFIVGIFTQLAALSFLYGQALQSVIKNVIFFFIVHSIDMGDFVELDGVKMIVEEIDINTTVFSRVDYPQKICIANKILSTKTLIKFPNKKDIIDFTIPIDTGEEYILRLKDDITRFIRSVEYWYPSPEFQEIDMSQKKKISLVVKHRVISKNVNEKWYRRLELVKVITDTLKHCSIDEFSFLIPSDDSASRS